ncbi:MAG TPA: hypothetical protein VHY32_09355 [Caulobacteraceae bacterium]|jgi:hypothetical protein|nr:hypothetical protein [Caulobacteraceae bacterium]
MSDNWLQFVPVELGRQPTQEAAERAVAILSEFTRPLNDDACARFTDEIEFVSPGVNWESVTCPACRADLWPWWADVSNAAAENQFRDLSIITPCCGARTSLHDLHYDWPAGFGKFVLESMNPEADTSPEVERLLEECLGMKLRKVWMHI